MADEQTQFAPADDVFAMLNSVPGINDNLDKRRAARERMEHRNRIEQAGPAAKYEDL